MQSFFAGHTCNAYCSSEWRRIDNAQRCLVPQSGTTFTLQRSEPSVDDMFRQLSRPFGSFGLPGFDHPFFKNAFNDPFFKRGFDHPFFKGFLSAGWP